MTEFSFSRIEGQVGIAVETTEGTAVRDPTLELFVLKGNTPSLDDIIDKETEIGAYNEPYLRKKMRGTHHVEGELPGVLLAPSNGVPQMLKTAFGNSWYSNLVYVLTVESGGGATFSKGDRIFGETSKAVGEVVRVVTDTLWLVGVQGTFSNSENIFNIPELFGGTDYAKNVAASSGFAAVTGYYCHKMDGVLYTDSSTSNIVVEGDASAIKIYTTAAKAMIADFNKDFRPYSVSSGNRKCICTVKDDAGVALEGWVGGTVLAVDYDGGTAAFTVGKNLTSGGAAVGTILAIDGNATAGTLWVDAPAIAVVDNAVLADNGDTPGAAVANMPKLPAYLYNAVKIFTDRTGSTQSWNGDITTFDETDNMSFCIQQNNFDQQSLTVFVKDAGSPTKAARGTKITEFSFDVNGEDYGYTAGLLGRTYGVPTNTPAFPACNVTTYAPYGAYSRTIEIDGSTSGSAGDVLDMNYNASFEFSVDKGTTLNDGFPTYLQPNEWGIVGTLNCQFLDDTLLKKSWGANDATGPQSGDRLTSTVYVTLDSGEEVVTGYNNIFVVGTLGTITIDSIDRAEDGFTLPVTLEGVMMSGSESFKGPTQFYIFDATASH